MITSPILYGGKNRKDILGAAVYAGNTVTAGLWYVVPTMLSKYVYTYLNFADSLVDGSGCTTPIDSISSLSEIGIDLKTLKSFLYICKKDYEGTYLEDDYMPAIEAFVTTALKKFGKSLEALRWVGNTASAIPALAFQNGVMRQLTIAGTYIPVAGALAANILDPTKVIAELNKALAVVPSDVRYDANFKIVMSPQVYSAFRQAAWSGSTFNAGLAQIQGFATNQNPALGAVGDFYGIPVYIAPALDTITTVPSTRAYAHCVLMGIFSNEIDSNLVMATNLIGDMGQMPLLDLENTTGAEKYLAKFEFKQGIGVATPSQVVLYI
jgi:hypothetical protein